MSSPIDGARTSSPQRILFLLFFLSGISGLLYQVVWMRMAIRVFGCTVYATSVVLSAFMCGLALGSWLLGRYADRAERPFRLYAILEVFAGGTALLATGLMAVLLPVYQTIFEATGGGRATLTGIQVVLVFLILIVPTMLMGGTLPVLSTALPDRKAFSARMAVLYGMNTLGAVVGVAGSGFVLIGVLGEWGTVIVGVIVHLAVAYVAWRLAGRLPSQRVREESAAEASPVEAVEERISPYGDGVRTLAFWAYGVSGFAALGYEVIWTRVLPVVLRTSVYAFSGMLAIYLLGIGLGSLLGRRAADRVKDPLAWFAGLECAVALLSLAGYALMLPAEDRFVTAATYYAFYPTYHWRLLVAAVVIFPTTVILGALFPLVARCVTPDVKRIGASIGRLYAMNTAGCILGSMACGFLLLPMIGTSMSMILLAGLSAAIGWLLFLSSREHLRAKAAAGTVLAATAGSVLLALNLPDPYEGTVLRRMPPEAKIYVHKENVAATTTATGIPGVVPSYRLWVNSEAMTALVTETKLMAYLPLALAPNPEPKKLLIICFGMGTTFKSAVAIGGLEIDTVELVPDVYECFGVFHSDGPPLLKAPNVRIFADDGRNYLAMTDQRYDVITIDPPPPVEAAGVVNFYSLEFHKLCRERLAPGGLCNLWVPSCPVSEAKMILRSFAESYPHITVWAGQTADGVFLFGSDDPQAIRRERLDAMLARPEVMADLQQWDDAADTTDKILGRYLMDREGLLRYTEGQPVITDNYPRTEFPLWRRVAETKGTRLFSARDIYNWMLNSASAPNRP